MLIGTPSMSVRPLTSIKTIVIFQLSFIAIATVTGCSSGPRIDGPIHNANSFGALTLFDNAEEPAKLPDKATVSGDVELSMSERTAQNVLVLSGGGSHGAFGAGLLVGWSESGKRPQFENVTGVSTGALMASLAFLGTRGDRRLQRFYTTITDKQVYTSRGVEGLFEASLYDTAPLARMISRVINNHMLDEVAEEHRKGRRLYVATTNLDLGKVVVWDMGGIANSGHPDRLKLYRSILLASAAVPGLFEPVYIRDPEGRAHMHVDGGIKAPILLRSFMVGNPGKKRTVYVIVNGKLSLLSGAPPVGATFKDISMRSISELMRGLFYKTIYQAYVTVRNAGGIFRITHIPDELATGDPLKFDKKAMRKLFQHGRLSGRAQKVWRNEPPRLERLERVQAAR
jgi:predicted patatin/cPLA2 family phospholipase